MKKRRILSLVVLAVLAVYLISGAFVLSIERKLCSKSIEVHYNNVSNMAAENAARFENGAYYSKNETKLMEKYLPDYIIMYTHLYMMPYREDFPEMMTIKDEDGKIIGQSRSMICYQKNEPDKNDNWHMTEFFICDLEKYLNDNTKKEIADYQNGILAKYGVLDKASFKKDGNEYIPVSITLFFETVTISSNGESRTKRAERTFEITDETPDIFYSRESDSNVTANVFLYDIDKRSKDHADYERLRENATQSHYFAGEYLFASQQDIILNGKTYSLRCGVCQDLNYGIRKTETHDVTVILFNLIFVIVLTVSLIATDLLYKKNRRLYEAAQCFSAAAAHELKTPLSVIQNQCECIMENIAPEKNEEYLRSIYDETLRMNEMIASLLQYNKIAGAANIKKAKCDLVQIVRDEAEKYRNFAEANGATLIINVPEKRINVYCNAELIAVAVDNYISNAVRYSSGEKRIIVTLKGDAFSGSVTVYNDGNGVDKELKNAVWNILSKADKARTSGNGSGMGLAINKKIFEFHSYSYGYRNVNGGVEFWFAAK